MSDTAPARGRLIALEGTGGRSMAVAARRLERSFRIAKTPAGISTWDSSAIFLQIVQSGRGIAAPPPRTLILLYAADLAFRLRWQIRPVLDEGTHVIAAPYLETVVAFGRAAGLSQAWLRRVFAFAPKPDICYRVPESTIPVNRKGAPTDSFLEFGLAQLRTGPACWDTEEIRRGFDAHLDHLESQGKCSLVTTHTPSAVPTVC
jgi:dTMP kinase